MSFDRAERNDWISDSKGDGHRQRHRQERSGAFRFSKGPTEPLEGVRHRPDNRRRYPRATPRQRAAEVLPGTL